MNIKILQFARNTAFFLFLSVSIVLISAQSNYSVSSSAAFFSEPTVVSRNFSKPSQIEMEIYGLINIERRKKGLRRLKWDKDLQKIARYYSKRMARENFFSHYDKNGNSLVQRAQRFKIRRWEKLGENLFFSQGYLRPSFLAVDGWLESRGHRGNILDKDWTHTAVGVYQGKKMKTFITQVFIKR